jgi:hypothetical protein
MQYGEEERQAKPIYNVRIESWRIVHVPVGQRRTTFEAAMRSLVILCADFQSEPLFEFGKYCFLVLRLIRVPHSAR